MKKLTYFFSCCFVAATLTLAADFPAYQSPLTAEPAILRPPADSAAPCTATLFANASLDSYSKVARAAYTLPACAGAGPWGLVVLEFHGAVKGVQFDRWGALWAWQARW